MNAKLILLAVFCAGIIVGIVFMGDGREPAGLASTALAQTQSGQADQKVKQRSPTGTVSDRDTYFPGTEPLQPDEMRITALGTGQPTARPKQAAACFLVELGNGDKFLFDIGAGAHERIAAQKIPYDYLDKIFISHRHVDHFGEWHNHESADASADLGAQWFAREIRNQV